MNIRQIILSTSVGLNAAAAMIVEIVAGRLLAPYFGMSLYTWTTVIGVVLAGLTVGHWLGGRFADRVDIVKALSWAFVGGAVTTLLILPLLNIVVLPLSRDMTSLGASIALSGFLVFFMPSVLAGLVQPLATKMALDLEGRAAGPVIGRMLASGAFGSIAGTFLAGFVLISYLGSSSTLMLVVAINGGLALIFMSGRLRLYASAVTGLAVILATLWPVPGFATPCHKESSYYCIQVDDAAFVADRPARLMALDHLVHSINDRDDPLYLESPYLHFVDEVARHAFGDEAIDAFFVGGGAFTLPRAWQKRSPESRLTVAEIDPVVTKTAINQLWYAPSEHTRILEQDARFALQTMAPAEAFDVIFGDAFHDIAIPQHLVTDEFNALVAQRLSGRGFYALNVIDDPRSMAFLLSMVRTLKQSFAHVEVWYSPMDVGGGERATFILLASAQSLNLENTRQSIYGIPRLWARLNVGKYGVSEEAMLLRDDFVPVDRLLSVFWF